MSQYCTLQDMIVYMTPELISQITDDQGLEEINMDMIGYVINQSSDMIDGYIRGRYPVPIPVPVPTMIEDIAARMAVFFLWKRGLSTTLPDQIKEDYNYCIRTLIGCQQGKINPFDLSSEPVLFRSNRGSWDDVFTRKAPQSGNGESFQPAVLGAPNTKAGFGQNSWQTYRI